ncbi:unnamed protein product [Parnassius mnemosyne]|uniref:Secreted protein n=1 Tax=Parnassius mnemosyne TaxID=213953 RepID=A0AAV1M706_9NEOP
MDAGAFTFYFVCVGALWRHVVSLLLLVRGAYRYSSVVQHKLSLTAFRSLLRSERVRSRSLVQRVAARTGLARAGRTCAGRYAALYSDATNADLD